MIFLTPLITLLLAVWSNPGTPEDFLDMMAGSPVEFWLEHRDGPEPPVDSIRHFFQGVSSISVTPGRRVIEELEDGYFVIFPESRWTYRKNHRISSVSDTTVIRWTPSGYRWLRIPVFHREPRGLSPTQGLCGGVLLTGAIVVAALIILGYARRRFRE